MGNHVQGKQTVALSPPRSKSGLWTLWHNMHPTGWLSAVQHGGKVPVTARRNQEEANGLRAFGVNLKSNAPETPSPGRATVERPLGTGRPLESLVETHVTNTTNH